MSKASKKQVHEEVARHERVAIVEYLRRKARRHGHLGKPPKAKKEPENAASLAARGFHLLQASILLDIARVIENGAHHAEERSDYG